MLVEIDVDKLLLRAATYNLKNPYRHECVGMVMAMQEQMPEGVNLLKQMRKQSKEYAKLTKES